jgi:hypothetical protein
MLECILGANANSSFSAHWINFMINSCNHAEGGGTFPVYPVNQLVSLTVPSKESLAFMTTNGIPDFQCEQLIFVL